LIRLHLKCTKRIGYNDELRSNKNVIILLAPLYVIVQNILAREKMAYRYDNDLEFLGQIESEDLEDLVYCLTHNRDGKVRYTEGLTTSDDYKKYYPDHKQYWKLVAAEIQRFGANSIVTKLRGGKGVKYKEVLTDVCDKMKVNYNKDSSVQKIENNLLMKILSDSIEHISPEDLKKLAESTGVKNTSGITTEVILGIFQAAFRAGSFKSYQLTLIFVNAVMKALVGRGLSFAGNIALTRTMAILTGPIGLAITGLWTAIDIAGPAYRVTIPSVIQVAVLRQKFLYEKQGEEVALMRTKFESYI